MYTIEDAEFYRLVKFMKSNYGINLEKKRHIIAGRLSGPLAKKGFSSFKEYIDYLLSKGTSEDIDFLINTLTTNYTYFLRESAHFDFFKDTILPNLEKTRKNKVLSIWSAGCSSGQEPYTLSIILKEYLGNDFNKWDTRILATDISDKVLTTAKRGVYDRESLEKLPPSWEKKYFTANPDGTVSVKPEIKNNVIFKKFNLMDPIKFKLQFDVIFCRNVMIYFNQETKDNLTSRFYNATVPGGYLLVGHSESVNCAKTNYKYLMPATYQKLLTARK